MIGALASLAGSFVQDGLNRDFQRWSMAEQQKYNLENMAKQFEYQQLAWNRENAYNDPRVSSARWRLAGIAPQAVYGSSPGGAGVAGSMGTPDSSNPSPPGNATLYRPSMTLAESIRLKNESKIADSVVLKNEAEARKAGADAEGAENTNSVFDLFKQAKKLENDNKQLQNDILTVEREYTKAIKEKDLAIKDSILSEIAARIDELISRKDLNEETRKNLVTTRDLIKAQTRTEGARKENIESQTKTENELRDSRKSLTDAQAKELLSVAGLNDVKNDREKYEMFLRVAELDDPKNIAGGVQKVLRILSSKFGHDLNDYQKRVISDYLEKIWSNEKP